MSYTLIGSLASPFVRKVAVVLREKGLAYEHEDVNPFAAPEGFREISPLGLIPALRHDGKVINDSSVICHYLERVEPAVPLYPSDPYDCARAEWLEEYMDAGVMPVAGPKVFFPRVIQPLMTGEEPDDVTVQKVVDEKLPPFFDYLDSQLGDSGHFIGDALTIADVSIATGFVNLRFAGVAPSSARWPKLASFVETMHGRDSFTSVIDPIKGLFGKRWVEIE